MLKLKDFQRLAHLNSVEHGFWDDEDPTDIHVQLTKTALIHEEASEVTGAFRDGDLQLRYREGDGKPEGVIVELADTVIRCCDLAEALGLDLEEAIRAKHAFNVTRPYKHGRLA